GMETQKARDLVVAVVAVKGRCPVYREGDSFTIAAGFKLLARQPLCLHALAVILPYYVALSRGVSPVALGLARAGDAAYLQCPDPCDLTGGGTVVFRVEPLQ
uniref:TIGR04076 family protein n=1 Tax=Thermodesulfitimonas autotrophica TaxID=1894989 RepID=UPI002FDF8C2E